MSTLEKAYVISCDVIGQVSLIDSAVSSRHSTLNSLESRVNGKYEYREGLPSVLFLPGFSSGKTGLKLRPWHEIQTHLRCIETVRIMVTKVEST